MNTRREFLKQTAAGAALALAAGTARAALPPVADGARMAIVQWKGASATPEDIRAAAIKLTEKAISDMGGMARFVPKGVTVWLKPNINFHRTPEFAANTNPDVVATVARLCFEAGAAKVKIADHSAFGAKESYPMSGIEAAARTVGAEMVLLDPARFKDYPIGGKTLPTWSASMDLVEAEVLINMPVAKNHPLPKFSGCLKNLMGTAGGDRSKWHDTLAEHLCDYNAYLKPRLHVVDAIRCILSGPPRGGSLDDIEYKGCLAAGVDPVALDAWASALLGHKPEDIVVTAMANARGLGKMDFRALEPRESTVG